MKEMIYSSYQYANIKMLVCVHKQSCIHRELEHDDERVGYIAAEAGGDGDGDYDHDNDDQEERYDDDE